MLSKNNNNQQEVYKQINGLIEALEFGSNTNTYWGQVFNRFGINISNPNLKTLLDEYSFDIPSLKSLMIGILNSPQSHQSLGTQKALKATKSALKAKEAPALNANAKAKEAPALKPNAKQKLDPMMSTKVPTVALKAQVSSTVLPPISDSPIQINQTTGIPDQASDKKSIKITYGVKGNEYFLAEQIDPTILKSASLADATQASIDVTTKVTRQLGLTVPLASGIKVTRADASTTYDNTLKGSFESIQGQGIKKTKDSTDDSINTLLATVVGPTAVKAIMDSGCWGETFRLYLDADMFERTSITEDRIPGLLEVYRSQPNGDNILSWLLKMSYCPVFELVSSDKLGAFNGLYTLELLNRLFPVVATLNIPKGSGGQVGIYNEVYIYSIILAAVLTNTPIQTLLPPQTAIELVNVFYMIDLIKTKLIEKLNLNSFLKNVNAAMSTFSNNGGIANTLDELENIWSTTVFMYTCIPAFFEAIESVLQSSGPYDTSIKTMFFEALENSYFAENDQQKFIAAAEEFTWFAFQMTRYKKTEDVYSDFIPSSQDLSSIFREERAWYKQKLNANREKFETEWPQVLTKVYLNEAYFGHDNKSKTLTEFASRADPRVLQIIELYQRNTGDQRPLAEIPWDNLEKWVIKKCQRDNRCMVFEACRVINPNAASASSMGTQKAAVEIAGAKTVSGVSFGTNTDMGYNNTINYMVPVEQSLSVKKQLSKESFSAGGGNPVNTLLTKANIGCKVVVTTYDLENYVSAEAMDEQGKAELDTMMIQWSSNVILNELMRRRLPNHKILEVQGILSTLDRASRTNNPGAIYATGHLLIPITILAASDKNPELLLQINYMVGGDPSLRLWQELRPVTGTAYRANQASLVSIKNQKHLENLSNLNYLISFMLLNAEERTELTNKIRLQSPLKDIFNRTIQTKKRTEDRPAENSKAPAEFNEALQTIFKRTFDQISLDQLTIDTIAMIIQEMATQYIDKFDVPEFISKGGEQKLSQYISKNDFWNYYLTYMIGRNKKIAEIMFFYITHASSGSIKQFTDSNQRSQFLEVLAGPDVDDLALFYGWDYSQDVRLNAALFEIIGDLVKKKLLGAGEIQGFFGQFQYSSDGRGSISQLSGAQLKQFLIDFFKQNPDLYNEIVAQLAPEVNPEVLAASVLFSGLSSSDVINKIIGFVELVMTGQIQLASINAAASAAVSRDPRDQGYVDGEEYYRLVESAGPMLQEQYKVLSGPMPMAINYNNTFPVGINSFDSMLVAADINAGYIPGTFAMNSLSRQNSASSDESIDDIYKPIPLSRQNSASSYESIDDIYKPIPLSRQNSFKRGHDSDPDSDESPRGKQVTDTVLLQNQIANNQARITKLETQINEARINRDSPNITNDERNAEKIKINKLKSLVSQTKQKILGLEQEIYEIENPEYIQSSQPGTPYHNPNDMSGGAKTNNSLKDLNGKPVLALYNNKEKKYYIISFEEYLKYWFNNQLEKIKKSNDAKGIKSTNLILKPTSSLQKDPYGVLARREAVAARGIPRPVNNLSNLRQLPFGRKEMTLANFPQSQSIPGSALVQSSTNSIRSRGGKSKSKKNKQRKPNKKYTKRRNKKRFSNVRKTKKRLNKRKRFSKRRKQ
jgi:hypothetical protein